MAYPTGSTLHGFRVVRVRPNDELKGTLYELEHEKTGAQLVWLDNGENNKLFCVTFKTLPEDSTGVFHILEHTVLCGSDKYPVKEPFVELLKSSMNTFLNAMTFPDKTMYPVSSRNAQDYLNLTQVYLDAVFAPSLLHNPNIFRQEGWHMEKDESGLSYKGVVLNEMKGALSDPDDVIEEAMGALLFPDNCYGFNSGGEPGVIQNLTYEKYVDTYHRFYHPSNARFYLDGTVPFEETLALIDGYLAAYERHPEKHDIPLQKPVCAQKTIPYAAGENDPVEHRTQYACGGLLGTWKDRELISAFSAITDYLTGSNEAPLTRAVLSSGLGEEVSINLSNNVAQPWWYLQVRGTDEDKIEKLQGVIQDTLRKIAQDGVDRAQFHAILNSHAFHMKEYREPAGLIRAISCTSSWLYGGDPIDYLLSDDVIRTLDAWVDSGEIDRILSRVFLESEKCTLTAVPSRTLSGELRTKEQSRLTALWDSLDEKGKQQIEKEQAELLAWQKSEDTPEALATIPMLKVASIDPSPMTVPTRVEKEGSVTVLYHDIPCHGIIHLSMYFPLTDFSLEDLTRIACLPLLYGDLPTPTMSVQEIQREEYAKLGTFSASVYSLCQLGDTRECTPVFVVRFSVLREHLTSAQELVMHILTQTQFDADDLIRERVVQSAENARMSLTSSGMQIATRVAASHFSASGVIDDAVNGQAHIAFLLRWKENFAEETEKIRAIAGRFIHESLCKASLTLSVTSDPGESIDLSPILSSLPEGTAKKAKAAYTTFLPEKSAIAIPAQIGYAVIGSKTPLAYIGTLRVLGKIVSLEYLWNVIRVQGGAYGSGISLTPDGGLVCYSYRDPTPARSLQAFLGIRDFLHTFLEGAENVDKYILSTVSDSEPLLSPGSSGTLADLRYLRGITEEMLTRERKEMLSATVASVRDLAEDVHRVISDACVCVTAHPDALSACGDLTLLLQENA